MTRVQSVSSIIALIFLAAACGPGDRNGAPVISNVQLAPAVPTVLDTITATVAAGDPDGDALELEYEWYVDDAPVAGASGDSLDSSYFQRGDTVYVVVTAWDESLASEPTPSPTLTVGDAAPVVGGVTLAPAEPTTTDSITASADTSDPDGDTVTASYAWYVNNALVPDASGATLDSSYFQRGDTVHVVVTADAQGTTSDPRTSPSVTVINSAPSAPVVSIAPGLVPAGGAMTCTVDTESLDADGDTMAYTATWTVDGAPYPSPDTANFTGDTVPAGVTQGNEVWQCTVMADDGYGGTAEATSAPVTVSPCVTGGSVQFDVNGTGRSGSIQTFTVPAGVCEVVIVALGARGGVGTDTRGASMSGRFPVTPGETLQILVGQQGSNNSNLLYGGGGTFVVDASNQPMVIAGGGGSCFQTCPATSETVGRITTSGGTSGTAPRADNGAGGSVTNTTSGGGGGFLGNGANATGGQSFMAGAIGGAGEGEGGFGGGGVRGGLWGQGGGGGYSGGSCGDQASAWLGCGGGGSFNAGLDQINTAGSNNGAGRVTITW